MLCPSALDRGAQAGRPKEHPLEESGTAAIGNKVRDRQGREEEVKLNVPCRVGVAPTGAGWPAVGNHQHRPQVVLPPSRSRRRQTPRQRSGANNGRTNRARREQAERAGANRPAPPRKISRGRLSKNRLMITTLNALAPAGSHTAQNVSNQLDVHTRHVQDGQVERNQQPRPRDEQRGQHQSEQEVRAPGSKH